MIVPDQPFSAAFDAPETGLYVHVPFCLAKCAYCGFHSVVRSDDLVAKFLNRLEEEILEKLSDQWQSRITTVFIGGGNPTSIGPKAFEKLVQTLADNLVSAQIKEWTVETNPETFTTDIARILSQLPGIRLNIGIQRLSDAELEYIGRRSSLLQIHRAMEIAATSFEQIGIDLIIGIPGLTSIEPALRTFLGRYPITHFSSYFLSIEEGTTLAERVASGEFADPDELEPSELFDLRRLGHEIDFEHYEISNFSKPGLRCIHNLNYWLSGNYLGLGPSAVQTLEGIRTQNPLLDDYLRHLEPSLEIIDNEVALREQIMLRLRLLKDGLDLIALESRFENVPASFVTALDEQVELGNIEVNANRILLTDKALPFFNSVAAALMDSIR